jgi:membrane-associated protease RseP (regulator of RpoE activity)
MTFTVGVVLFAIGIGLSIALHEFGHLLTAKAFGMKATKYMVGFGPTIWSFKRGETEYGLKAIPAGGYVKIIGMTPLEDDDDERSAYPPAAAQPAAAQPAAAQPAEGSPAEAGAAAVAMAGSTAAGDGPVAERVVPPAEPEEAFTKVGGRRVRATGGQRAFWRFPTWQRVVVLSAGSVTHLGIALVVIYLASMTSGLPTEHAVVGTVQPCVVTAGDKDGSVRDCRSGDQVAPAAQAGLRAGDRITKVGTAPINTFDDLTRALRSQPGATVALTVVRGGNEQVLSVPVATVRRAPVDGEKAGNDGLLTVGAIGVSPSYTEKYGAISGAKRTVSFTGTVIGATFSAIGQFPQKVPKLLSALAGDQRDPNGPVSVVGVSRVGGQALEAGSVLVFVLLFAGFNIFVGVFNLFPLLPLDGGHIAILLFERVRSFFARVFGRVDPGRVDYAKLMPLTMLVVVIFGGISLLAILADIVNPIADPFK